MNLWFLGALSWLQAALAVLLALMPHASLRTLASGAALALLLLGFLPQGLRLCSPFVLVPSLVLGIILSVFVRESVPQGLSPILMWTFFLMIYTFLQANGTLPVCSILYFIPIALSLPRFIARDLLLLIFPLMSFTAGCLWSVPPRWQGLLLCLACGMMLGCISHHKPQNFADGIAIGVILSFL